MATSEQLEIWEQFVDRRATLTMAGLRSKRINFYNRKLVEKLRNIYSGGIPASIMLLSTGMCNGHCYDRALLMSRAFIDEEDDINLLYLNIKCISLNPNSFDDNDHFANHCVMERITKEGKHLIYDTTMGFIYDKELYWEIEEPEVKAVVDKKTIKMSLAKEDEWWPEDVERDKDGAFLWLPCIEYTYGAVGEKYAQENANALKYEVELYKQKIGYDEVVKEATADMNRMFYRH